MSDFAVSNVYRYDGSLASLNLGGLLDANLLNFGTEQSGVFSDDDGRLDSSDDGTTNFAFDGTGTSGPITYLGSGEIYTLGLLGIRVDPRPVAAFQVDGEIYLYAPEGLPLLSAVTFGLDIDPNAPFILPSDGKVDGLETGETMTLGYTDLQGDQITLSDDTIYGNSGDDTIDASGGDDYIDGGEGADVIAGGTGDDTVHGGEGNDIWRAGASSSGSDEVYLEGGDDYAEVGYFTSGTPDTLDGGDGQDTVAFDSPATDGFDLGITLNDDGTSTTINFGSVVTNFEHVRGNSGENAITGNSSNNELSGLGGDDTLEGRDGDDTLLGGDGDDILVGGQGSDSMSGGDGNDTFFVTNGSDGDGDSISGGNGPDDTGDHDVLDLSGSGSRTIDATQDTNDSGALTGTVTFENGETLHFSGIEEIICFTPGTTILTPSGEIPVQDLKVGDKVVTRDNGLQAIRWVGKKKLVGHDLISRPKLRPIMIRAGALGHDLPKHDMMVSPNHRMLLVSQQAQLLFGASEVLVAAKHLVGADGVQQVDTVGVEYVHFLCDNHEVVLANGSWSESFQPGTYSMGSIDCDQREEIYELFPELRKRSVVESYAAARLTLKRHEAFLLTR